MANSINTTGNFKLLSRPGSPLVGEIAPGDQISIPGDKSLSHRAALFAALADGKSHIRNFLVSGVTRAMLDGLTAMNVPFQLDGSTLLVQGRGGSGFNSGGMIYINCGNSGTTMRLLAGAFAGLNLSVVLDGSKGLKRRPMGRIIDRLSLMGVNIQGKAGRAPLKLTPVQLPLKPIDYTLPVASAQVKSCLMLASLAADGETFLREPGPSRDHTERMLSAMGVDMGWGYDPQSKQYICRINPPIERLRPLDMTLPVDISAASFVIVAALIVPGSNITLRGIGLNPTRSGILDALAAMGANIKITNRSQQGGEPVADLTVQYSRMNGIEVNGELVVRMIDEFPIFAVAAAHASGNTLVKDAVELRHKESDRISALCRELSAIGVAVEELPDGFGIQGGKTPEGGVVSSHGDHRLAMSLAVAGLASKNGVVVDGAHYIQESFPEFDSVLQALGADLKREMV